MAFVSSLPLTSNLFVAGVRCQATCRPVRRRAAAVTASASSTGKALIFDCDGVIVESEELHRISYNQCWQQNSLGFEWSYQFYEMLQNSIGGGKEKMRWYFDKYGWPDGKPSNDELQQEQRQQLINRLHAEKTALYKKLIEEGQATVRPGVLRLMDEAYGRGLKLAICSAANAQAVNLVLSKLVGVARLQKFDLILAGDVVSKKKPDPMIYNVAREKLQVDAQDCVVIEDSQIGLRAALDANMTVVITHTPYTASQSFEGAAAVYAGLGEPATDADADVVTVDTLFPELAAVRSSSAT
eukprot:TRINITY_DN5754_c0_g1_i1.p1 TRINITY_DN5754_c0_g1~~TRINITY_DN5754_c0_g1_i1.p1  ORF type:complete len:298 (+),score=44.87 TRINITY_DN5754_c0_g1_i1:155-1048(+)